MKKGLKLVMGVIIFIVIILLISFIFSDNYFLVYSVGSLFVVAFLMEIFKIIEFYNRKIYLLLTMVILSLGFLLSTLSLAKINQNFEIKIASIIVLLAVIVIFFNALISNTRKWN